MGLKFAEILHLRDMRNHPLVEENPLWEKAQRLIWENPSFALSKLKTLFNITYGPVAIMQVDEISGHTTLKLDNNYYSLQTSRKLDEDIIPAQLKMRWLETH